MKLLVAIVLSFASIQAFASENEKVLVQTLVGDGYVSKDDAPKYLAEHYKRVVAKIRAEKARETLFRILQGNLSGDEAPEQVPANLVEIAAVKEAPAQEKYSAVGSCGVSACSNSVRFIVEGPLSFSGDSPTAQTIR